MSAQRDCAPAVAQSTSQPNPAATPERIIARSYRVAGQLRRRGLPDMVIEQAVDYALHRLVRRIDPASGRLAAAENWEACLRIDAGCRAARLARREVAAAPLDGVAVEGVAPARLPDDGDDDTPAALWAAFDTLAPRQRQAIELRVLCGLSVREAAREMGISASTVRLTFQAAVRNLRKALS